MAEKPFKVSVFQVDVPENAPSGQLAFDVAIGQACNIPRARREKPVNLKDRRLERYSLNGDIYLLNFTTFEYPGPGRVQGGAPATPVGLASNEFFANETAMLYDAERKLAFIESARGGMGAGAIAKYFAEFSGRGAAYDMMPMLDPDAAARARRCRQFRRVEMRVAPGPTSALDRESGVGAIEAFGDGFGAEAIDVVLRVGRERSASLLLNRVQRLLNSLSGDEAASIERLSVYGRENEDDPLEVIDLLQHREKRERMLPVDSTSRSVLHHRRWSALEGIRREFLSNVP